MKISNEMLDSFLKNNNIYYTKADMVQGYIKKLNIARIASVSTVLFGFIVFVYLYLVPKPVIRHEEFFFLFCLLLLSVFFRFYIHVVITSAKYSSEGYAFKKIKKSVNEFTKFFGRKTLGYDKNKALLHVKTKMVKLAVKSCEYGRDHDYRNEIDVKNLFGDMFDSAKLVFGESLPDYKWFYGQADIILSSNKVKLSKLILDKLSSY